MHLLPDVLRAEADGRGKIVSWGASASAILEKINKPKCYGPHGSALHVSAPIGSDPLGSAPCGYSRMVRIRRDQLRLVRLRIFRPARITRSHANPDITSLRNHGVLQVTFTLYRERRRGTL